MKLYHYSDCKDIYIKIYTVSLNSKIFLKCYGKNLLIWLTVSFGEKL